MRDFKKNKVDITTRPSPPSSPSLILRVILADLPDNLVEPLVEP